MRKRQKLRWKDALTKEEAIKIACQVVAGIWENPRAEGTPEAAVLHTWIVSIRNKDYYVVAFGTPYPGIATGFSVYVSREDGSIADSVDAENWLCRHRRTDV